MKKEDNWIENKENIELLKLITLSQDIYENKELNPKKLFFLFVTDDILETIVNYTNTHVEYLQSNRNLKKNSRLYKWKKLCVEEFKIFLGILFYMDIVRFPRFIDHWSEDSFKGSKIKEFLGKSRFEDILYFFYVSKHYTDEEFKNAKLESTETFFFSTLDDKKQEKKLLNSIIKIDEIFNKIQINWRLNFYPSREVSIDERTIKFKGRSNFVMYNPMKPVHYGFRAYVLADSQTGYTWKMKVHANYDKRFRKEAKGNENSQRIVLELIEGLKEGHIIFADSYYTSIELARKLEGKGIAICGSISKKRKELPEIDYDKIEKYETKIFSMRMKKSDLSIIIWRDNKILRLITNIYETNTTTDVVRTDYINNITREVKMPSPILEYNKFMGGVDLSDQFCSYIETEKKTCKWWKKLFFHIMDVCIVNAWILYKKSNKNITLLEFKLILCKEILCKSFRKKKVAFGVEKKGRHFPDKGKQKSCIYENCKRKSSYFCKACNYPLCVVPCFELFHTSYLN